jgi:conjugative relaxase-like TrwC/TraI family protein
MFRVQNINGHQVRTYHKKDECYYMQEGVGTEWDGKLAEENNLFGTIEDKDFERLVQEHDQKQDELDKLNEKNGTEYNARAGIDMVFSVPKSCSIAMHLNDQYLKDITEAHHKALEKVVDHIEKNYIYYRQRVGDKRLYIKSDNILAARIDHLTSRNLDPQFHSHYFIFNKTRGQDGKMRAISNEKLIRNQQLFGQMYRQELMNILREKHYALEITDKKYSFFELAGISRKQIEIFSTRRKEIVEMVESKKWDNNGAARDLAWKLTRKSKKKADIELLIKSWKYNFKEVEITDITKDYEPVKEISIEEKNAFIGQAVEDLTRKKFAFREEELAVESMKKAFGSGRGIECEDVKKYINDHLGIELMETKLSTERYICTRESYELERAIWQEIGDGKMQFNGIPEERISMYLENAKELTQEQREAVFHLVGSKDRYVALQGIAGGGKTFLLSEARKIWEGEGCNVIGMSFMGTAANSLKDAGIESSTIHRFLNNLEKEAGNWQPGQNYEEKHTWDFSGLSKTRKEIWVVDEASTLNNNLFKQLQNAAVAKGAAVVLVGDYRQLGGIGQGQMYRDLLSEKAIDVVYINENIRQKDLTLKKAVKDVAMGDVKSSLKRLSEHITERKDTQKRFNLIAQHYASRGDNKRENSIILTGKNIDREAINQAVRERLVKLGKIDQNGFVYEVRGQDRKKMSLMLSKGDKIIFLKNDFNELNVQNGTRGVVLEAKSGHLKVRVGKEGDYRVIDVDLEKYNHIDYGYCMTPNKAQSISEDYVMVNVDTRQQAVNSRQAFYVDISRGRQEVLIYTNDKKGLHAALKNEHLRVTSKDFLGVEKKAFLKEGRKLCTPEIIQSLDLKMEPIPLPVMEQYAQICKEIAADPQAQQMLNEFFKRDLSKEELQKSFDIDIDKISKIGFRGTQPDDPNIKFPEIDDFSYGMGR